MSDDVNDVNVVSDKPEVAKPKPKVAKPKPAVKKNNRGVKPGTVRGPYKKAVTNEEIVLALFKHYGLIGPAAKTLGLSRECLDKRLHASEFLRVKADEASEAIVDLATQSIVRLLLADHPQAVMFTLKTKGRTQGWQETVTNDVNIRSTLTPDQARAAICAMFGLSKPEPEPEPKPEVVEAVDSEEDDEQSTQEG